MEYHDTVTWKTAMADSAPKIILESTSFQYFPKLDRRFYEETTNVLHDCDFRHIIDVRRIDHKGHEAGLDRRTLCRLLCDSTGTVLCRLYDASFPASRRLFHKVFRPEIGKVIEFTVMFENGVSITTVNASLRPGRYPKRSAFFHHADFLRILPKETGIIEFRQHFREFIAELPENEQIKKMMNRNLLDTSRIDNAIRLMQCMYSSTWRKHEQEPSPEPFIFPGMKQQISEIDFETLRRRITAGD